MYTLPTQMVALPIDQAIDRSVDENCSQSLQNHLLNPPLSSILYTSRSRPSNIKSIKQPIKRSRWASGHAICLTEFSHQISKNTEDRRFKPCTGYFLLFKLELCRYNWVHWFLKKWSGVLGCLLFISVCTGNKWGNWGVSLKESIEIVRKIDSKNEIRIMYTNDSFLSYFSSCRADDLFPTSGFIEVVQPSQFTSTMLGLDVTAFIFVNIAALRP